MVLVRRKMRKLCVAAIAFLNCSVFLAIRATAQDGCGNPNAPRIFIHTIQTDETAQNAVARRSAVIGNKLSKALADRIAQRHACVLFDDSLLSEPSSFPALRGSALINISVQPSLKDADNAAIAIEIEAVEDIYVEKNFHIGTLPLLIEKGTQYDSLANDVLHYWDFMNQCFADKKCPNVQ
jgi:hypothetical protein